MCTPHNGMGTLNPACGGQAGTTFDLKDSLGRCFGGKSWLIMLILVIAESVINRGYFHHVVS